MWASMRSRHSGSSSTPTAIEVREAAVVWRRQTDEATLGLADYQQSTTNSAFMKNFVDKVLPGDGKSLSHANSLLLGHHADEATLVSKLREFRLTPGTSLPPNVDLIP